MKGRVCVLTCEVCRAKDFRDLGLDSLPQQLGLQLLPASVQQKKGFQRHKNSPALPVWSYLLPGFLGVVRHEEAALASRTQRGQRGGSAVDRALRRVQHACERELSIR